MEQIKKLQNQLKEFHLDAFFIISPINRRYLTGFPSSLGFLIVTKKESLLFLDSRYYEAATKLVSGSKVIRFKNNKELMKIIKKYFQKNKVENVGFEENKLTYAQFKKYNEIFNKINFIPAESILSKLRLIKTKDEITNIKKAVDISKRAFQHILNFIKPGMSEKDLQAELEYTIKRYGGYAASFDIIFISGPKTSMPHGVSTSNKIKDKDIILVDFGVLYNGYVSDITRTFFIGEPNKKLEIIYQIVLKAQKTAISKLKVGMTCEKVDSLARNIIKKAGFERYFNHSLGHGIGLEVHERPTIAQTIDMQIKTGMIFTIEPGIYIPGLGGVRIEDNVLIKRNSTEVLTKDIPKDLLIL